MNISEKAFNIIRAKRDWFSQENEKRIAEIEQYSEYADEKELMIQNIRKQFIAIKIEKSSSEEMAQAIKKINGVFSEFEKRFLQEHGYPADYLQRKYYCNECKDNGDFCICIENEKKKLFSENLKSTICSASGFDEINLEFYGQHQNVMGMIFTLCKRYADMFSQNSDSIFMFGKTGLGKTHFSTAIVKVVIEKGFSAIYYSVMDMFRKIEDEHFSEQHSHETLDMVSSVDLLVLDDLGTEMENRFYKATLYEILEKRINHRLPTIVNSNLNLNEISKRYGERIGSRLSAFMPLEFVGEDIRQKKALLGMR